MADRAGFDNFVAARSPRLLRVAYLLTRDWNEAEDLPQTALVKAWFAWGRLDEVLVKVNGQAVAEQLCSATGGGLDGSSASRSLKPDRDWQRFGVELGKPLTVSMDFNISHPRILPSPQPGAASIGVYVQVPWDTFPFPPQPSTLETFTTVRTMQPHKLATMTATNGPTEVTLPRVMDIGVQLRAPGVVSVYLDGVLACKAISYDWNRNVYKRGSRYDHCDDVVPGYPFDDGRYASFHYGQRVTLTVVAEHFIVDDAWRVELQGN